MRYHNIYITSISKYKIFHESLYDRVNWDVIRYTVCSNTIVLMVKKVSFPLF